MKPSQLLKFLSTLLFAAVASFAQAQMPEVTYYERSKSISTLAVQEDTLWVGTDNGLFQYATDGSLIKIWGKYNRVESIAIDNEGNKWIGTWGGVSKYDGTSWTTYTTADGLANNRVYSIAIDTEGTKWIGHDGRGVFKYDGTSWTTYTTADGLARNYVYSIAIDDEGNKWIGTWGGGVSKYDGTSWTTYTTADGLADNSVYSIAIDNEGNKWFGTWGGVSKYDGTSWTTYTTADGLAGNYVYSIAIDTEGNKWFGTNGGVSKYDGTSWTTYTTADGLASNRVRSIAIDTEGNKWFGTYGRVSKYDGTNWTTYTFDDGPIDVWVSSVAIDNEGNKWFGTSWEGVSKFDGTNWTSYTTADGLASNRVRSIAIDNEGNKWFGTYGGGVSKYDGTSWTTYTTADGLADNDVYSIAIDNEGNKWFGTSWRGVSKYDGTSWTTYTTADGLASVRVYSIAIDTEGNKWFGTDGGVSKYDGTNWTAYTTTDGLAYDVVYSIAIDNEGNKWFGTAGGVSKYDGTNWTTYTTADGLADNYVNSIAIDTEGNKWFGTDGGVSKYEGVEFINIPITDSAVVAIDNDGVKWFGTRFNGVISYNDGGAGPYIPFQSSISGTVFYDQNRNGIQDADEQLLPKQLLQLQPSGAIIGNFDGKFSFQRPDGAYSLEVLPIENWECTTDSSIDFTIADGEADKKLTFGLAPVSNETDLIADIVGQQRTRASFDTRYWLNVENQGAVSENVTVKMKFSDLLTYNSASIEPASVTENTLEWMLSDLGIFEREQITVDFTVADVNSLGDTIKNTLTVASYTEDLSPENNTASISQVITGSYDPNDKQEQNGVMEEGYTLFDDELLYTVRFQNMGTDTAFNIKVVDRLSKLLDIRTFRLLSSSDSCTFTLEDNHILTFRFNDIMLPHEAVGKSASNGYVKFSIKTVEGLEEFSEIENKAEIYFDYNPPIVTNTALNTMVSVIPQEQIINLSEGMNLVSALVTPIKHQVAAVFPNAETIKNFNDFYDADIENFLNGIKNINGGSAYIISNSIDEQLRLVGYPEQAENPLLKTGWNLLYYPQQKNAQIETAFSSIIGKIELIRDEENLWSSDSNNTNTLTELQAGKAYLIKVTENCVVEW